MGGWPVPKRMRHLSRNSSSITSRLTRDVSGSKMIGAHSASEHERPSTAQLAATPLTRRVPSRDGTRCVTSRVLLERPRGIRRSTARARVRVPRPLLRPTLPLKRDRKSTRLNSSHPSISYAVFCLKKQQRRVTFLHSGNDSSTGGGGTSATKRT